MSRKLLLLVALVGAWAALTLLCWWLYRSRRWPWPLHRDLLAVALLAALDVGFFWPVVFQGAFLPKGGGDLASFLFPRYAFAARSLSEGVFPLWNPHLYGGQPYLADIQSGLLYPPNLVAFLLSRPFTYRTLEALAVAHYWLGAVAMYVFGRRLGLGVAGSLVGAVVWGWSGFLVAHLGHYNMVAVAVWMPLVLALLLPALRGGSLLWAVGAAVVLGVSTFAGHTQLTLYTLLAIGLFGLVWGLGRSGGQQPGREVSAPPRVERQRAAPVGGGALDRAPETPSGSPALLARLSWGSAWLRALVVLAVTGGLAAALTAVQLLPSYELTRLSLRAEISYDEATAFSFLPQKLITLVVPHFYGRDLGNYWGPPSMTENFGYVGILPLVLALVAVLVRRDRATLFFGLLGALGLLLSFGPWTPLHGWLFSLVPGFDKVRAPGRFLVFVDLAVAGLAAVGADALLQGVGARRRSHLRLASWLVGAVLVGMLFLAGPLVYLQLFVNQRMHEELVQQTWTATSSFALAVLFLAGAFGFLLAARYRLLPRSGLAACAVGLVVVDLFAAGGGLNPTWDDPTIGFRHQPVIDFLKSQPGLFRIDTVTGVEDVWQPDTSVLEGIPSVWGLWNPFVLSDYYWLWKQHIPGRSSPQYDVLNARYVLGHKDVVLDWEKFKPVYTEHPVVNVYENTRAMPRVFVVGRERRASSHDEALRHFTASDFDPRREVVVEGAEGPALPPQEGEVGRATVERYGPNGLTVRVEMDRPGYLVVSDVFYPGWEAWVDGRQTPVLRANWTFRAVRLDPGAHVVEMRFRPRSFFIGLAISGTAWGVVALGAVMGLLRRRSALLQGKIRSQLLPEPLASRPPNR